MESHIHPFDEHHVIHELQHYLPAQAPLKDFVHHNTLHAFQGDSFHDGLRKAAAMFGYKVSLTLNEFRKLYKAGRISDALLRQSIVRAKGLEHLDSWYIKATEKLYPYHHNPRVGRLRAALKKHYTIDLDSMVHPLLFRLLCSYLDQGIAIWNFPDTRQGFLAALQAMERNSLASMFKGKRAKQLLLDNPSITGLLRIIVGENSALYEQYLFDQQFAHQGWSGMVSVIEQQPETLLDTRKISLHDLIIFELLLEIDALDYHQNGKWSPIDQVVEVKPIDLYAPANKSELHELLEIWQEAYEWSFYDQVLAGIRQEKPFKYKHEDISFQGFFCIDDRICSFRRYLEQLDEKCETYGTPGFFNVEFYFKPQDGKFLTKVCPAPVFPKYVIKEYNAKKKKEIDVHFHKETQSFFGGYLISHTLGFWSALKLFINLFRPSMSPSTASSLKHMDRYSDLTIENTDLNNQEEGLQVGFTIPEMAQRVEGQLRSIGLVDKFAPIIYVVSHGASSVNNPHYAAYDCGACSGRAGSVNARAISYMGNHPEVRAILAERGIVIPEATRFVGALHDTTRDDIVFYDEASLSEAQKAAHAKHVKTFNKALDLNAKERSRRFESIDTNLSAEKIHEKVRTRSVSLFEPRPELNHATNALCIVGRRGISKGVFLDRRSFLNSYDYTIDPDGSILLNIMKAVAPVCGGINLEYYFSRVDNQKLGAGSKLPHNVMGLFGVANGIDGDLRPGLPSQMIEVHDPLRLLVVVEQFPQMILDALQRDTRTYDWFLKEWVMLVAVEPETKAFYRFKAGAFELYEPVTAQVETIKDLDKLLATDQENFPVYLIN
jgi:uncharacterized protein YbcC (UPF0753/DUF2309 family)